MPKFDEFAVSLLKAVLPNAAVTAHSWGSGQIACGSSYYVNYFTATLKVGLSDTPCTRTTRYQVGGSPQEQSLGGTSYVYPPTVTVGSPTTYSSSVNDALTWSSLPAFTWRDVYIGDSSPTQKLLVYAGGTVNKTINSGDTILIGANDLGQVSS